MSVPSASTDLMLVVVTHDEAASITRCLLSTRPFADRMVVLDTDPVDDTMVIAQSYDILVSRMARTNDFSTACGTTLRVANADQNLILDADEQLGNGDECLRIFSGATPSVGVACVKSGIDTTGSASQLIAWIPRLLLCSMHYTGRIHEQPVSSLPAAHMPVVVYHNGYTTAKMQKKGEHDTQLLLNELAHRPDDPYVLYQLDKETELHHEDCAKAVSYYARAFGLAPIDTPYHRNLALRYVYSLDKIDHTEETLAQGDAATQTWPGFPDLCFALGLVLLDAVAEQLDEAGAR